MRPMLRMSIHMPTMNSVDMSIRTSILTKESSK